MPTLSWIGKDKVVNHHLDVPFRTLEKQYTFASEGHQDDGNMIIHGDNLDALKALLPQYEGAGEVHLEGHLRGYRKGNTDGLLHETHANNRTITHACNCSY